MKRSAFFIFAVSFAFVIVLSLGIGFFCHGDNSQEVKKPEMQEIPKITYLDAGSGKVKEMEIEEYLVGVLAAEMPAEYNLEALKAQSVAARSYILNRTERENPDHPQADVCTESTHCKAYISETEAKARWEKEKADEYWEKLCNAVSLTEGEVVVCEEKIVEAFFFAGSGGKTENSEEVWGEARSYLKSVESPGDAENPKLLSVKEVTCKDAKKALEKAGKGGNPTAESIQIGEISRTEGGSVKTIQFDEITLTGSEARSIFGLKSANFTVENLGDKLIFTVRGSGHGVGMSQRGANFMAENGKNYTEILSHYYTNIQIMKLWDKKTLF